jgi:citrate/tricarballylate utilization protein
VSSTILKEAERVMTICNACRYCEGFCAVFPAMELRRTFTAGDLKYLANLCHNCRDCYYACQYAPPHEFDLNVPKALGELRLETYHEFSWPAVLKRLWRYNGLSVSLITVLCIGIVLFFTIMTRGEGVLFDVHTGANAFYHVIPYTAMVLPFSALAIFSLISLWKGARGLWEGTGVKTDGLLKPNLLFQAIWDALRLKYLDGGGYGCNYPDDRFSMIRRYLHHSVFYGFFLCLASTTVAAGYDHLLQLPAPYPLSSWPVLLGSMGGFALLIGTGGLLYLKITMDRKPAVRRSFGMDIAFIVLLGLTAFTGLILLFLRATSMMGILLTVHIGMAAGLFITMPYSKFVHGVYRWAALVQNAAEQNPAKNRLAE